MNISKPFQLRSRRFGQAGFTLAELVVVATIAAAASGLCIPLYSKSVRIQRGTTCGNNLKLIQGAKQAALADDPNVTLNASVLQNYLPNGVVPACPSGGTYSGMLDATVIVTCSRNADPVADPAVAGVDVTKNGQHDPYVLGGQQTLPTLIAVKNPIMVTGPIVTDPVEQGDDQ